MNSTFEDFKWSRVTIVLIAILVLGAAFAANRAVAAEGNSVLPNPGADVSLAAKSGKEIAVFAGGCFWGIQAVFQHVHGVTAATSGYSGGASSTAEYEVVSTGQTGHADRPGNL